MKNKKFNYIIYKSFPALLMISVFIFIIFMVLGFTIQNELASNIFFTISFVSLICYVPSFMWINKLQNKKWFKAFAKCENLKKIKENKKAQFEKDIEELKQLYNLTDEKNDNK